LLAAAESDLINFFEYFRAFVVRIRYVGLIVYLRVELAEQKNSIGCVQARTAVIELFDGFEIRLVHGHEVGKLSQVFAQQTAGAVRECQAMFQGILSGTSVGELTKVKRSRTRRVTLDLITKTGIGNQRPENAFRNW
jgi:hypothetical protein